MTRLKGLSAFPRVLRQGGLNWLGLLVLACLWGCGVDEIPDDYGRHRESGEYGSVNGTDVLAGMFTAAGHEVYFRRTLVTSDMEAADVVVWVPDDQSAPRDEVCEWFDNWLTEQPGRVVIFVGRHFSAAPLYWKFYNDARAKKDKTQNQPSAGAKVFDAGPEVDAEMDHTDVEDADPSGSVSGDEDPAAEAAASEETAEDGEDWAKNFTVDVDDEDEPERDPRTSIWFNYTSKPFVRVKSLAGPWSVGIDAAKTQIELSTRLVPNEEVEKLLWSGDDADDLIVSRYQAPYWDGSQLLLVVNGSFTLNLPLVNHEHRKLAARLVAEAGSQRKVVFLESRAGGPQIDPPPVDSSIWTLFEAWPLGAILLQLAVVGVMFGFVRWPIFGRPKQPPSQTTSDFAEHVTAVGQLIARTKDRSLLVSPPPPPSAPNP